jgi:hypothetical protein
MRRKKSLLDCFIPQTKSKQTDESDLRSFVLRAKFEKQNKTRNLIFFLSGRILSSNRISDKRIIDKNNLQRRLYLRNSLSQKWTKQNTALWNLRISFFFFVYSTKKMWERYSSGRRLGTKWKIPARSPGFSTTLYMCVTWATAPSTCACAHFCFLLNGTKFARDF